MPDPKPPVARKQKFRVTFEVEYEGCDQRLTLADVRDDLSLESDEISALSFSYKVCGMDCI